MTTPQNFHSTRTAAPPARSWATKLLTYALVFGLLLITWPQTLPAPGTRSHQRRPSSRVHHADPRPVATTRRSHRALSRFARRANPRGLHFPRADRRSRPLVQNNPGLKGDALAQAVDQKNWDPSVKALTAFPSVLGNMDKNISWTSSLGDAYYNQQQDVMDAVQVMRQKAEQAGNLKSTPQQTVENEGSTSSFSPRIPRSFTSPPTIRGPSTAMRSRHGLTGITIPAFGTAARIFLSVLVSEWVSSVALAGAGDTGVPTGTVAESTGEAIPTIRAAHFLQSQ